MKLKDVVLGTTYRVREWDSMLAESSLDVWGAIEPIDSTDSFCAMMKYLCGTLYTPKGHYSMHQPHEGFTPSVDGWYLSAYMLEPIS